MAARDGRSSTGQKEKLSEPARPAGPSYSPRRLNPTPWNHGPGCASGWPTKVSTLRTVDCLKGGGSRYKPHKNSPSRGCVLPWSGLLARRGGLEKRWRDRQYRELKKLIFSAPSKCLIDLYGALANRMMLKRLHARSAASVLHAASKLWLAARL